MEKKPTPAFTPEEQSEMRKGVSNLANVWMEMAREATNIAHARRTLFNAYVAEGFTEDQALALVKTV